MRDQSIPERLEKSGENLSLTAGLTRPHTEDTTHTACYSYSNCGTWNEL